MMLLILPRRCICRRDYREVATANYEEDEGSVC
jgi:hypothetical protein